MTAFSHKFIYTRSWEWKQGWNRLLSYGTIVKHQYLIGDNDLVHCLLDGNEASRFTFI